MSVVGKLSGIELLGDREIGRIDFRTALFRQHAWDDERARKWALRLAARDLDKDDRHLCVECSHLTGKWACRVGGTVVAEALQQCPKFAWETP